MSEVTFASLSVEARTEVIKEAAEESAWAIESTDKKIARLAELLKQQKAALGHGNWIPWIKETFGDSDAAVWKVQRWMRGLANNARAHYLELGDEPESPKVVPRSERKTGRVAVEKPMAMPTDEDPHAHHENDPDDDENAVPPEPKTNTHHTPATAKAKETDRKAPPIITPVIIEEPPTVPEAPTLADWPVSEIIGFLKASADEPKKRAKELRKAADELDPPSSAKPPSKSQLITMIPEDWDPELRKAAADWAEYKQARAKGERIQTIRAWQLALEKFTGQPLSVVVLKVNRAIENSWKGWDHDSGNKQAGHAIAGTGRIRPAAIDESAITWK